MSSRALSLATVLLLIGFGATDTVLAQATNLEAGKAPSQLFAQTCSACHKSPRGLLKTVAPGSLPGFLRQHYTTSSDMAGVLASYLVSNGATDTRYQAKDGKDKKDGAKEKEANTAPEHQGRRQRSQDAAKPDGEAAAPEGARQKRAARPPEEGSKEGAKPEGQAAPNITLVTLPAHSPELSPPEGVWRFLKGGPLAHRLYRNVDQIMDKCCAAWRSLVNEPGRIRSLCSYAWLMVKPAPA